MQLPMVWLEPTLGVASSRYTMRIAVSEEGGRLTKPALFLGFLALFSPSQGLLFDQGGETRPSPQVETFELQSQVFKNLRTINFRWLSA